MDDENDVVPNNSSSSFHATLTDSEDKQHTNSTLDSPTTKEPFNSANDPEDNDSLSRSRRSSSSSIASTAEPPPLSESSRLKGYLKLAFLSCLAFVSAYESDLVHCVHYNILDPSSNTTSTGSTNTTLVSTSSTTTTTNKTGTTTLVCNPWNEDYPILQQELNPVPSTPKIRDYAMVVCGVSAVGTMGIVILHWVDHASIWKLPNNVRGLFQPGSLVECILIIFLGFCKSTNHASEYIP